MFYAYKSLETFLSHFQSILRVTHTHTHTQSPQIRGLGRDRLDVNLWEMCWMPLLLVRASLQATPQIGIGTSLS